MQSEAIKGIMNLKAERREEGQEDLEGVDPKAERCLGLGKQTWSSSPTGMGENLRGRWERGRGNKGRETQSRRFRDRGQRGARQATDCSVPLHCLRKAPMYSVPKLQSESTGSEPALSVW